MAVYNRRWADLCAERMFYHKKGMADRKVMAKMWSAHRMEINGKVLSKETQAKILRMAGLKEDWQDHADLYDEAAHDYNEARRRTTRATFFWQFPLGPTHLCG